MMVWMGWGLLVILIAVHMTRPFPEHRRLSAARFFNHLPPMTQASPRLHVGNPLTTPSIYLRMIVMGLAIVALLDIHGFLWTENNQKLGVWIVVDTSASMTTIQDGQPRMNRAMTEIRHVLDQVVTQSDNLMPYLKLSTVDMERRNLITTRVVGDIRRLVREIQARPLGTDLNQIRRLLESDMDATMTHLVVISDQPAPQWFADTATIHAIWKDISIPTANLGFTRIYGMKNPLTGLMAGIVVDVTAFGDVTDPVILRIDGEDEKRIVEQTIQWNPSHTWRMNFQPPAPGRYELRLEPGGNYRYDDRAVIDVPPSRQIRVQWEAPGKEIPILLGWLPDAVNPHLRVLTMANFQSMVSKSADSVPWLILGPGYPDHGHDTEILYFDGDHPLLTDVNLDVVASLGSPDMTLLPGFQPILTTLGNKVWIAESGRFPAVVIPGLPEFADTTRARLSMTIFFNAATYLLHDQPDVPLYTLTSPDYPKPEGNRLALHPDEGHTVHEPRSYGDIASIGPVRARDDQMPLWPMWMAVMAGVFLMERILAFWAGVSWR